MTKATQHNFSKDVRALSITMEEMGNPFLEESTDLLVLDTRDIVDRSIVDTLVNIEALGKQQYDNFVQDRIIDRKIYIQEPIKRNKISLFKCPNKKVTPKQKLQLSSLKSDCSLFSRLYISCQVRGGNLDEFFEYENQPYPHTKYWVVSGLSTSLHIDNFMVVKKCDKVVTIRKSRLSHTCQRVVEKPIQN